jgi:hypothetical protein
MQIRFSCPENYGRTPMKGRSDAAKLLYQGGGTPAGECRGESTKSGPAGYAQGGTLRACRFTASCGTDGVGVSATSPDQATQSGSPSSGDGPNAMVYKTTALQLVDSVGIGMPSSSGARDNRCATSSGRWVPLSPTISMFT